jgi:DNA-binding transcriptional ArsR family regulator
MLNDILVSQVRVSILKLFFTAGAAEFYHVRDITRRVDTEINAVRRELLRLTKAGILKKEPRGNRVYYRVRELNPYISDLATLVNKDTGLCRDLIDSLEKIGNVKLIILSKPFLYGRVSTVSDIDLLVVGKPSQEKLGKIIKDGEVRMKREVNYTILSEEEFEFRKKRKDPFLLNILLQPRIVVFGDENKYCQVKL